MYAKKIVLNPSIYACDINKYLKIYAYMKSFTDDLVVKCAKIIDTLYSASVNSDGQNVT